ncbi:MAG TPA: fibronectin type III domain-containing protein, partial [Baekduia sp.]
MTRRLVILFTLIAGALVPAVAAVGAARASAPVACATVAPAGLRLAVDRDGAGGTLRWRVPAGHPPKLSFRVARDGAVVGQTSARQMRVSLAPSRAATITVTAVLRGARTRCHATVHVRGKGPAPAAVQGLSTTPHRGGRVTLSWEPPMPGAHPVRGYRLRRDGRTAMTLKHRSVTLRVPAHGTQRLQLAVLDTAGRVGPWSSTVTLKAGHVPPKPPVAPAASDVTDTAAALSWGRARAFGARIAGYRLVRDGRTVQTTKSTLAHLTGLPLAQSHTYRIVAVDTLGWTSEPSQSVKVTTGRRAPASPAV